MSLEAEGRRADGRLDSPTIRNMWHCSSYMVRMDGRWMLHDPHILIAHREQLCELRGTCKKLCLAINMYKCAYTNICIHTVNINIQLIKNLTPLIDYNNI